MTTNLVLVDSRDREYTRHPDPNEYVIRLPTTYKNVVAAKLRSIELPATFYVFTAALGNTSIKANLWDALDTYIEASATVTIPDGNYNTYQLVDAFAKALTAAFSGVGDFVAKLDDTTMRMTVTNKNIRRFQLDTRFFASARPSEWGLGYYLGFDKGMVYDGVTIASPRLVSSNPYTYLLLEIEGFNQLDECGPLDARVDGAFAKIPLPGSSFDYVMRNEDFCMYNRAQLRPIIPRLDQLRVRFRFHDGQPVNFQHVEHSFTLELVCQHA